MNDQLKQALWWALAFVSIAMVIAAGVRIVDWITMGQAGNPPQVWRTALVMIGASAMGGTAITMVQKNGKG